MTTRKSRASLVMRPFARSLPMQLLRAREALMQEFRPHLRKHGVTEQQWRVLRALAEVGASEINSLAEACQILPASLSRMLPAMQKQGHIVRRLNKKDQRSTIISITSKGTTLFQRVVRESEQIYSSIERRIGSRELMILYDLLERTILVTANTKR